MANILLLDESEIAGCALLGILSRGHHVGVVATSSDEAWRMLREGVVFDLVVLEPKACGGRAMSFLERLRQDAFWKILPVVIYTSETESRVVKRALALKVQNFLIKPYRAQSVYDEIAKALQTPWRTLLFEDARTFAAQAGVTPEALAAAREEVRLGFEQAAREFPGWAERRDHDHALAQIRTLIAKAEAAGVWAGLDVLRELQLEAWRENWTPFAAAGEALTYASQLIHAHLSPSYVPRLLRAPEDDTMAPFRAAVSTWQAWDVARGPFVEAAALRESVSRLSGFPVVESAAAALRMLAGGGGAPNLGSVVEIVGSDSGLCLQLLMAANRLQHDAMTPVEDAATAVNLLGEAQLVEVAANLPTLKERAFDAGPLLNWPDYWTFQVAVSRMARFTCAYLGFDYLSSTAAAAGLVHDAGRMLLAQLQPGALGAILTFAADRKVTVADAERAYLGCTTRELAAEFGVAHGLPQRLAAVMRFLDAPEQAGDDRDLVAIVAIARQLCLHAHVGASGEPPAQTHVPIATTEAWQVVQGRLFPSFDLKKFEVQAHAFCLTLRSELSGRRGGHRPTHAQRAAELV